MNRLFFLMPYILWAHSGLGQCPVMTPVDLKNLVEKHPSIHLVFFSPWCGSCREHLMASPKEGKTTLYIGTFDSQERITQAIEHARGNSQNCFWDQEQKVAEFFGVKEVPFDLELNADSYKKFFQSPLKK